MRYAIILAALLLAGCGGKSLPGSEGWAGGGPSVVSMDCKDWTFRYGRGMPVHPECVDGN
jgi:hypothetical protein